MDKIVQLFALFSEKFTQLTKNLRDRRSQRSRQISTLSELNGEYVRKARNTDRQYCGTAPGTTGPVGAFGEGSEDLHSLIHHLAISRLRVAGPQKGRRGQVRSEEA